MHYRQMSLRRCQITQIGFRCRIGLDSDDRYRPLCIPLQTVDNTRKSTILGEEVLEEVLMDENKLVLIFFQFPRMRTPKL